MRKVAKKVCKLSLFSQLSAPIKSGVSGRYKHHTVWRVSLKCLLFFGKIAFPWKSVDKKLTVEEVVNELDDYVNLEEKLRSGLDLCRPLLSEEYLGCWKIHTCVTRRGNIVIRHRVGASNTYWDVYDIWVSYHRIIFQHLIPILGGASAQIEFPGNRATDRNRN